MIAEQLAAEREFWASVKASEDPADLRAFLEQFPGGTFEKLARNLLGRLEEAAQRRTPHVTPAPAVPSHAAAPATSPSPRSVEEALGLTRAQRVLVQRGLTALGFDVGAADGIFGPRTRAGIGRWQSSRGAAATGHLDAGAAETLLEAQEATPPEPRRKVVREIMALLSETLSAARRIERAFSRARALGDIAEAQASAGDLRGAAQSVSEALSATRSIEGAFPRAVALGAIAKAQASAGDIHSALSTARRIEDEHVAVRTLSDIARAQASAGDIQGASSTARRIEHATFRALALGAIAEAQASAGDTHGAAQIVSEVLSMIRRIESALARAQVLSGVARAQASGGDTRGAAHTASEARGRGPEH